MIYVQEVARRGGGGGNGDKPKRFKVSKGTGGERKGGKPAGMLKWSRPEKNSKMLIFPVGKIKCVRNEVSIVDLQVSIPG